MKNVIYILLFGALILTSQVASAVDCNDPARPSIDKCPATIAPRDGGVLPACSLNKSGAVILCSVDEQGAKQCSEAPKGVTSCEQTMLTRTPSENHIQPTGAPQQPAPTDTRGAADQQGKKQGP